MNAPDFWRTSRKVTRRRAGDLKRAIMQRAGHWRSWKLTGETWRWRTNQCFETDENGERAAVFGVPCGFAEVWLMRSVAFGSADLILDAVQRNEREWLID